MTDLPLGKGAGSLYSRNPTLVPNFDRSVASGSGTIDHQSPSTFVANNPRANATCQATIGGSVTTGDILTLEVQSANLPGGLLAASYTTVTNDTLFSVAEGLAKAFNDNANAQGIDLEVDAAQAVMTFNMPGPIGNHAKLVAPLGEQTKITVGGTALTGDQIIVLFSSPNLNGGVPFAVEYPTTTGNTTTQMAAGLAAAITANAILTAAGISATNTAAVVNFAGETAAVQPLTITAYVNTIAATMVIGGSVATGDVNTLTVTGAALPGSPIAVSATALVGGTTTTVAAQLAAAINANATLAEAGITATNTTNTVNIHDPGTAGQLRFTFSTTGSETGTPPTTPTETATVASQATETITLNPSSGVFSGGSGPIIPTENFAFTYNGATSNFWYGQPVLLSDDIIAAMLAQGLPII